MSRIDVRQLVKRRTSRWKIGTLFIEQAGAQRLQRARPAICSGRAADANQQFSTIRV
jgi:hypothetical protein